MAVYDKEVNMIENLQTSFKALEIAPLQLIPGWYWDVNIGWFYVDQWGNRFPGNPYTGQLFTPLGFYPEHTFDAKSIRADAPINVLQGQSIKVDFDLKWTGPARDIIFIIGNCHTVATGIPPFVYDIGDSVPATVHVDASVDPLPYSGSGTFVFRATVHTKPHLFINPQDVSPSVDTVYLDAFTKMEGEISDLRITSYESQ